MGILNHRNGVNLNLKQIPLNPQCLEVHTCNSQNLCVYQI